MKRSLCSAGLGFFLVFGLTRLAHGQGSIFFLPSDGTGQQSDSGVVSNLWLPGVLSFSGASSSNYVGNADGITLQIIPALGEYPSNDVPLTYTPLTISIGPSRPIFNPQSFLDQPTLFFSQGHPRGLLRRIRARRLLLAIERGSYSVDLNQQLILLESSRERTGGQMTGVSGSFGYVGFILFPIEPIDFEIPEPTTLGLIALGGALFVLRKTRRHSSA